MLPVSYCVCDDEETGYHMYYNPKSLEPQGYSSFSQGKNGHIRTIIVGLAHQVASGSGPDTF
jgi:hypothetical protein